MALGGHSRSTSQGRHLKEKADSRRVWKLRIQFCTWNLDIASPWSCCVNIIIKEVTAVCLSVLGKISCRSELSLSLYFICTCKWSWIKLCVSEKQKAKCLPHKVYGWGRGKTAGSGQCQFLSVVLVTTGADVALLFRGCPRHPCPTWPASLRSTPRAIPYWHSVRFLPMCEPLM